MHRNKSVFTTGWRDARLWTKVTRDYWWFWKWEISWSEKDTGISKTRKCVYILSTTIERWRHSEWKLHLLWFCVVSLRDWPAKFNQWSQAKRKPIATCNAQIFPRFAPATCNCFVFLLARRAVCVCCDWSENLLGQVPDANWLGMSLVTRE